MSVAGELVDPDVAQRVLVERRHLVGYHVAQTSSMCCCCGHKGPSVDCSGRTSEDCRQDRTLNAEMKRLWNEQPPNP